MHKLEALYPLKIKALWKQFWQESFAFWMICGYLFFEYVRPQSIYPAIDILPWTSIFIGLSAIGILFDKNRRWVSDPANKWMILFFGVILLSSFNAYYPDWSWRKLEFFYTWLIIYFLIINIVNTPQRFYIFLLLFCLASFKLSLHGATSWAERGFGFTSWGIKGPPGFFQNSGELSIQMLMIFPLGYYLYTSLKNKANKTEKVFLMLLFITPAMTILGASSRGSQIALVVQIFVMFYRQIFKPKVLLGLILASTLIWNFIPEEQKDRFTTIGDDKTSEQRMLYWTNGLEIIGDHLVLGIGYFNFVPYYEAHYQHNMLYDHAELPHNIFVQVGTDVGLLGLAIYLLLILRFYKKSPDSLLNNPVSYSTIKGVQHGIIGFLVAGQFVTVGYYPYMWIALALIGACHNSFKNTNN